MSNPLYKVLVNGKSCHAGAMEYSLPKDGNPGEWQHHIGELTLCESGLHLTDKPNIWYKAGCKVYLAEAKGIQGECTDDNDHKVVCRSVRLIREATEEELNSFRIFTTGTHTVRGNAWVHASGDARVYASGDARVIAYDNAYVLASGDAWVRASGIARVNASGNARVHASGNAQVSAFDNALVNAYDNAVVNTSGDAVVYASGNAKVERT